MSKIPVEDRCTCKRDDNKKPGTPIITIMIGLITIYWW